jgi:uncharacterized protein YgiM (DUF1202 family)
MEKNFLLGGRRMESCLRFSLVILLASVCTTVSGAQAEKPFTATGGATTTAALAAESNDANLPATPFMAEVTSDDVYVRSGAGTNYYYCNKLNKGDKLKVVGSKFSWLQIVAPPGCYTWISSQYVQVNPQDKTQGTVIGDAVRVYAGSDDVQPMHSTSALTKLNKGEKVTLLGEEKEGYSKIAPPDGAYLWVSNQYVRPLGSLVPPTTSMPVLTPGAPPSQTTPFPTPVPGEKPQAAPSVKESSPSSPGVSTTTPSAEDPRIKQLDELKKAVDAEKAKPVSDQNFVEIKKALSVMAADKQSTRIARIAQSQLKTVERYELSQTIAKSIKEQDEQFGKTTERIEKAKAEKMAEVVDMSIFAVIGQFKVSTIEVTPKLYRILNSDGKTICYAQPAESAAQEDFSMYIDKKVGLIGAIETRPSLGDAVVVFTKVIELQ